MVLAVLGYALLTDLATALGALPFAFVRSVSERWQGIMTAIAGGMMVAASVFSLAEEGLRQGSVWLVSAGLLAGAAFIAATAKWLEGNDLPFEHLTGKAARQSWLLLLALFAHSFPEGVAIGVGFATGEFRTGLLLAIAIAVHNIPEGLALSLPLRARGVSVLKCAWYAILSSLPQPIAAVPAYLLATLIHPFLPFGLGFAGGAMIFLVVQELVPDSLTHTTRSETAWGFMAGLLFMMVFVSAMH
jgi:zinc transporter ZupT